MGNKMKTKRKKNDTKRVNPKYIKLLSTTYDKYKDLSIIKRTKYINSDQEEEKTVQVDKTPRTVRSKSNSNLHEKLETKRSFKHTFRKLHKRKHYTPKEDEVIVQTLKSKENKPAAICELSKVLNRTYQSIADRIAKLETAGVGEASRRLKAFSLEEDLLIIDNSLQSLKLSKSISETKLDDIEELAKSLNRHAKSVSDRWDSKLKVWLLSYYQKTLNLEIRPMLINVLAENFDSIRDINWDWVLEIPEFSGYTSISLRRVFRNGIIVRMAHRLKINRTEMTLQTIAETAKDFKFGSVISDNVRARQRLILDYFEEKVKMKKIEFVEQNL